MAGPTPVIIPTNVPNEYNFSFGVNMFSLYDTAVANVKFGLQIYDTTPTLISDTRQYPNLAGYAHFDVQNILKNKTVPTKELQLTEYIKDSANETFEFTVDYGWEGNSGVFQSGGTFSGTFLVIGGTKRFDDVYPDFTPYIPNIANLGGPICPVITSPGKPFSDLNITINKNDITDGVPDWLMNDANYTNIYHNEMRVTDDYTITYMNQYQNATLGTQFDGIKGFLIDTYNGDTHLESIAINNTTFYGGQYGTVSAYSFPLEDFKVLTVQCGQRRLQDSIASGCTHFYVSSFTYADETNPCDVIPTANDYYPDALHIPTRIDIVEDECNDFEQVQVSWLNSYGFRDYFYFSKRRDFNINVERNSYDRLPGNWNESTFGINSYERGDRVFSQQIREEYVINTKYLSDEQAVFLQSLYKSPDVKVRFGDSDEWFGVKVLSNNYTEKTFRKNKFFQYELRFELANKQQSLRG